MYFSATASKIVPMFLAAVVLFSAVMAESSDEGGSIYTACNVGKYSNGSQFDTNLEALFKSLTENAAYAGFGASVYGQDTSDQLSGRLQCSPHLSPADCRTCLAEAVNAIRRDCPNAIGARVQLERCFLRYENYTFLTVLDTNLWYSVANVTKETDIHLDAALRGVLADLSSRAPVTPLKFALGSSAVVSSTWNVSIYAMKCAGVTCPGKTARPALPRELRRSSSCPARESVLRFSWEAVLCATKYIPSPSTTISLYAGYFLIRFF